MPDPGSVLDLIEAYRRSKTMFAAVELGIFDGVRPKCEAVGRLMDACVSLGLLEKRGAQYVNTALADEYLRANSPRTLVGYVRYSNAALYPLWGNLEDAVREGTARWTQTFGRVGGRRWSGVGILAWLERWIQRRGYTGGILTGKLKTENVKRGFTAGMHGLGMISSPLLVAAFDLSRFRRLVDLGGASGHLALAARQRYPQMRICVFDLAAVIEEARRFVGDQVELVAGDFFADPLPQADLYSLGKVLHTWSDEKARRLLAKIYAALPNGGGLLVTSRLLQDDCLGPAEVTLHSLNMLVASEGREYSFQGYRTLLEGAGFVDVQVGKTGAPLDAILAIKRDGIGPTSS
jgi:acetylserotonin N-methyltransferase